MTDEIPLDDDDDVNYNYIIANNGFNSLKTYTINKPKGLENFKSLIENPYISSSGIKFKLNTLLDIGQIPDIGYANHPFEGEFDGGENTITYSNNTVSSTASQHGFFSSVRNATIRNLTIDSVDSIDNFNYDSDNGGGYAE